MLIIHSVPPTLPPSIGTILPSTDSTTDATAHALLTINYLNTSVMIHTVATFLAVLLMNHLLHIIIHVRP